MSRLLDGARRLVARLRRGARARHGADEADAYEAAVRRAFLSAEGIEFAAPRRRSAAPPERMDEPPPEPMAELPPEPVIAAPTSQPAPAPVAAAPVPGAAPTLAAQPAAADRPGHRHHRQSGETAPDRLLEPPANVGAAADEFFSDVVRRVEGDH